MTIRETKRQNFNVTPEQEAELEQVRELLDAPNIKEAILQSARIVAALAGEVRRGNAICVEAADGSRTRLLIPELRPAADRGWKYLVERPHPWRRQLYVKGRRLPAAQVWSDMIANHQTIADAARNWDLPAEAIEEILRYCKENRALLDMEADEEGRRLRAAGIRIDPPQARVPEGRR